MRSTKLEKQYRRSKRQENITECSFCATNEGDDQFVEGLQFFKIIKNKYPYTFWDGQDVVEHLMIVPRQHSETLVFDSDAEKIEYVDTLMRYEKNGYNIYARSPHSVIKSMPHQHTHLIKPGGPVKRFVLVIKKPLIRIIR